MPWLLGRLQREGLAALRYSGCNPGWLVADTKQVADYDRFDKQLKSVNRRVTLLAQYAPHRLYELRSKQAERFGEDALTRALARADKIAPSRRIK